MELAGAKPAAADLSDDELELVEAVVTGRSTAEGSTARRLDLRKLFAINLLALSRRGRPIIDRLKDVRFVAGDVLLLQMPRDSLKQSLTRLGLLPLARRDVPLARIPRLATALVVFTAAIVATSVMGISSTIAFTGAAVAMIVLRVVSVRDAYEAVDWPILVLLAAMIPVGGAFESSGAAEKLTGFIASTFSEQPA